MTVRIATRRSPLARAQAALVADLLTAASPGLVVEFVLVDTTGDRDQTRAIESLGERGVFSRGVQAALLDGRADIAVHSYKDLPTEPLAGLRIAAVPVRADPRDALVSRSGQGLADLSEGASVGTGSARRSAQVLAARPDLRVQPLRGNVGTRVGRVRAGQLDAAVLAVAGLERRVWLGTSPKSWNRRSFCRPRRRARWRWRFARIARTLRSWCSESTTRNRGRR